MKQKQFIILLAGLALLNLFFSCKKDETYMSNATIIGWDARKCACCGGTEIIIDNVASPNGNSYFLIGQLPADFDLGNNPKFPAAVKINYKINSTRCFGNYVDISKIAKR